MAAPSLSLNSSIMLRPSHLQNSKAALLPSPAVKSRLSFLSSSLSSLTLNSRRHPAFPSLAIETASESSASLNEPESDQIESENEADVVQPETETDAVPEPKREEVFAVVMVGSRQYIVFPGRYIYTQRLKDANVNDKIALNKVLLVGTKTSTWIGKPIVPNATVHAIVEEQTLDKKVIVFKYKKKKNYRRNIGHRQPITRIRITGITVYQDSPFVTLPQ